AAETGRQAGCRAAGGHPRRGHRGPVPHPLDADGSPAAHRGGDTFTLMWLRGLVRRRAPRMVGLMLGVALAVAFLGALGGFFAAAKANLTRQAIADVPVDWQVQLNAGTNAVDAARTIGHFPGVQT